MNSAKELYKAASGAWRTIDRFQCVAYEDADSIAFLDALVLAFEDLYGEVLYSHFFDVSAALEMNDREYTYVSRHVRQRLYERDFVRSMWIDALMDSQRGYDDTDTDLDYAYRQAHLEERDRKVWDLIMGTSE